MGTRWQAWVAIANFATHHIVCIAGVQHVHVSIRVQVHGKHGSRTSGRAWEGNRGTERDCSERGGGWQTEVKCVQAAARKARLQTQMDEKPVAYAVHLVAFRCERRWVRMQILSARTWQRLAADARRAWPTAGTQQCHHRHRQPCGPRGPHPPSSAAHLPTRTRQPCATAGW